MINSIFKFIAFVVLLQISTLDGVIAQNLTPTSIIGNELLFKDCSKAEDIILNSQVPITPAEKDTLAKYLDRIIALESFSNQLIEQKGIPRNLGLQSNNLDMSHLFDPERDKKAKLCAIKIIPKLYPQSALTIIKLLDITRDKKNSLELRDSSFDLSKEIISIIQRNEFPEYLVLEILNNLQKNENVLRSRVSIPLMLAIANRIELPWLKILEISDPLIRGNTLDALIIHHLNEKDSFVKIHALLEQLDDGAKAQLIMRLQFLSQNQPRVIEIIPTYLSSSSELVKNETLKLLKYLAAHPSIFASYYTTNEFPEKGLNLYLKLLKESNETFQKEIVKALIHVELKAEHPTCIANRGINLNSVTNEELSNDNLAQTLIKSICSLTNEDKTILSKILAEGSVSETEIASAILIHHHKMEDINLKSLTSKLNKMKKTYSSKEYSSILQTIIRGAISLDQPNIGLATLALAAEGLGFNLELSPILKLFNSLKENPAVELLADNFKISENLLIKALKEKSSLIKGNALGVLVKIDSKKFKFSTNLISTLVKLLDNEELEIRRLAYLALKSQESSQFSKFLNPKQLNSTSTFYISRLLLEHPESTKIESTPILENFVTTLNKLDCRERTSAIPATLKSKLTDLKQQTREQFEAFQLECLNNPSYNIKLRTLTNLISVTPLSAKSVQEIVALSGSLFTNTNEKAIYSTLLDLIKQNIKLDPNSEGNLNTVLKSAIDKNQREDVVVTSLNWIIKNNEQIGTIVKELQEVRNHSDQTVEILSNLLVFAAENNPENFDKLRDSFNKNIELSKELILTDVTNLQINIPENLPNLEESSPYFQIFINTILCNSKQTTNNKLRYCSKVLPLASTIIDKPDLVGSSLNSLIIYNSEARDLEMIKSLLDIMVSMGNTEEIIPSLKHPLTISALKELRTKSNNLAYSKILDYLIEY